MATPDLDASMEKQTADHVSNTSLEAAPTKTRTRRQPPELVRNLSSEERARLERNLTRKIDLRLLPMIILMYIMV